MKKQKNSIIYKTRILAGTLVLGVFLLASCKKDDDTTTNCPPECQPDCLPGCPPPATNTTYELQKVSGDNQTGEIGKDLPKKIVVKLVDNNGAAKSGVNVTFKVTGGGGSAPTGKLTESNGEVQIAWKLGQTVGEQLLQASVNEGGITTNTLQFEATGKRRDCITEEKTFTPSDYVYTPPFTSGGDKDYGGNGPKVDFKVKVYISSDKKEVWAEVYMKARETEDNWTTAEGTKKYKVYTVPSNRIVQEILTEKETSFSYTDSNHQNDVFTVNDGLVSNLTFVGDTSGEEAGTKTKVTIKFSGTKVKLKEVGDCN